MTHPLIELSSVAFGYGSFNVLDDIDLHLHPGQFIGLVGPSGAGKTSLLKLVLALLTPNAKRGTNPTRAPGSAPDLRAADRDRGLEFPGHG